MEAKPQKKEIHSKNKSHPSRDGMSAVSSKFYLLKFFLMFCGFIFRTSRNMAGEVTNAFTSTSTSGTYLQPVSHEKRKKNVEEHLLDIFQ